MSRRVFALLCPLALTGAAGCYQGGGTSAEADGGIPPGAAEDADADADAGDADGDSGDGDDGDDDGAGETGAPEPGGAGPSDYPPGRVLRRMTADQYMRSLVTATGQNWPDYEQFAGAMGKADFAEITAHDRTLSLTFDKFAHDAALYTCRAAVTADVEAGQQVILRHADVFGADLAAVRSNVAYLMLRFLAVDVPPDDPRVDPLADLVLAATEADDQGEVIRERWTAVCVALATHPDFVAY